MADSKRRQRLAEEWVKGKNFIFWFVSFTEGQIYRQIFMDLSAIAIEIGFRIAICIEILYFQIRRKIIGDKLFKRIWR